MYPANNKKRLVSVAAVIALWFCGPLTDVAMAAPVQCRAQGYLLNSLPDVRLLVRGTPGGDPITPRSMGLSVNGKSLPWQYAPAATSSYDIILVADNMALPIFAAGALRDRSYRAVLAEMVRQAPPDCPISLYVIDNTLDGKDSPTSCTIALRETDRDKASKLLAGIDFRMPPISGNIDDVFDPGVPAHGLLSLARDFGGQPDRRLAIFITRHADAALGGSRSMLLQRLRAAHVPVAVLLLRDGQSDANGLRQLTEETGGDLILLNDVGGRRADPADIAGAAWRAASLMMQSQSEVVFRPLWRFDAASMELQAVLTPVGGELEDALTWDIPIHAVELQTTALALWEKSSALLAPLAPCEPGICEKFAELEKSDQGGDWDGVVKLTGSLLEEYFGYTPATAPAFASSTESYTGKPGVYAAARAALLNCRPALARLSGQPKSETLQRLDTLIQAADAMEQALRLRRHGAQFGACTAGGTKDAVESARRYYLDWLAAHPQTDVPAGLQAIDSAAPAFLERCLARFPAAEVVCYHAAGTNVSAREAYASRLAENIEVFDKLAQSPLRARGLLRILHARRLADDGQFDEALSAADKGLLELSPPLAEDAVHWLSAALYARAAGHPERALVSMRQAWTLDSAAVSADARAETTDLLFIYGAQLAQTGEAEQAVQVALALDARGAAIDKDTAREVPAAWPLYYAFALWQSDAKGNSARVLGLMGGAWQKDNKIHAALPQDSAGRFPEFAGWLLSQADQNDAVLFPRVLDAWSETYIAAAPDDRPAVREFVHPPERMLFCAAQLFKQQPAADGAWFDLMRAACGDDASAAASLVTPAMREMLLAFALPEDQANREQIYGPLLDAAEGVGIEPAAWGASDDLRRAAWLAICYFLRSDYARRAKAEQWLNAVFPVDLPADEQRRLFAVMRAVAGHDAARRALTLAAIARLGPTAHAPPAERLNLACELLKSARECGASGEDALFCAAAGRSAMLADDLENAVGYFKAAESRLASQDYLAPRDFMALAGDVYLRRGLAEDAIRLYDAMMAMQPSDADLLQQAQAGLVIALVMKGDFDTARARAAAVDSGKLTPENLLRCFREADAYRRWRDPEAGQNDIVVDWQKWQYDRRRLLELTQAGVFVVRGPVGDVGDNGAL